MSEYGFARAEQVLDLLRGENWRIESSCFGLALKWNGDFVEHEQARWVGTDEQDTKTVAAASSRRSAPRGFQNSILNYVYILTKSKKEPPSHRNR
jgi:hypothetical protein